MSAQQNSNLPLHKYRPDIDGLRAIAVSAVVIYHAFPNLLKGGFIGVDVFFVLSGFLISSIIFEGLEKGSFNFFEFYTRRIKRIFPALLVVLISCLAFGWFALLADEYKQLGKHTAAGASFVSNFILWSESGYFDISAEVKPLLHLWSLGIEEQFYIIWPLLLWLAWKNNLNLFILTSCLAITSFIFNVVQIKHDTVAAFYSPEMRFWELLCGSLLAWLSLYKRNLLKSITFNIENRLKNLLSFLGLFLLCFGFLKINQNFSFPGKWALIPVFGSVLLIMGGPSSWINQNILSNRIIVFLGLISYPLYLWHWPLLSFARIINNETPSITIRILLVLLSILLAWLTFKFIERPVRFGKNTKNKILLLIIATVIIWILGFSIYLFKNSTDLNTSQLSYKFPQTEGCSAKYPYAKSTCYESLQKYPKTIVLIGDSHMQALTYGFKSLFDNNSLKFNVLSIGKGGCSPFLYTNTVSFEKKSYDCDNIITPAIHNAINRKDVEWIVLIGRHAARYNGTVFGEFESNAALKPSTYYYKDATITTNISSEAFELGLKVTINEIIKSGKKLIFVHQLPELGFDPRKCLGRFKQFKSLECSLDINIVNQRLNPYKNVTNKILINKPNIFQYNPSHFVCSSKACKPFNKDGILFYKDDDHMSMIGSEFIAKEIFETIIH